MTTIDSKALPKRGAAPPPNSLVLRPAIFKAGDWGPAYVMMRHNEGRWLDYDNLLTSCYVQGWWPWRGCDNDVYGVAYIPVILELDDDERDDLFEMTTTQITAWLCNRNIEVL